MNNNSSIIYFMPCKPGSLYINVTSRCLNNCLFCIKRKGPEFFGQNLLLDDSSASVEQTMLQFNDSCSIDNVSEIVFCGMGEPLLRYSHVVEICRKVRLLGSMSTIRIDTSGLFWSITPRLDFLAHIDLLSISLNAESEAKYLELCRPQIDSAYQILTDFIHAVKEAERSANDNRPFPEIRLSVVDTSEWNYLPISGTRGYQTKTFPVPDFEACRRIAEGFGWPLIVKRLFRDSDEEAWKDIATRENCAKGIPLERCRGCSYRH